MTRAFNLRSQDEAARHLTNRVQYWPVVTSCAFIPLAFALLTGCTEMTEPFSIAEDEMLPGAIDALVLIDAGDGSPCADTGAVRSVMDAVLDRAAHAPSSHVRVFLMMPSGPPLLLLNIATPELPRRPRTRSTRIESWVIEERERVLGALAPQLTTRASRSPVVESIARVASEDPVGEAERHLVVCSDLRETVLGNFAAPGTTPTVRQTLARAARRHLLEAGALTGIAVHIANYALMPGHRRGLDCSMAHQTRLEERFDALLERGGASSVDWTTGPPRFDSDTTATEEVD